MQMLLGVMNIPACSDFDTNSCGQGCDIESVNVKVHKEELEIIVFLVCVA